MAEKAVIRQLQKPILAVDVDSTIADITAPLLDLIKKEFGKDITREDMTEHDMENVLHEPKDKLHKLLEFVWAEPDKIPLVDPDIPGVLAALQSKYEIHILTATLGDEATVKKWLADHNIPYDKYVHVNLPTDKQNYNADVFIDDDYEVVAAVSAKGKRALLVKQPWNAILAKIHTPSNVTVIDKWDEAEKLLLMTLLRR
jgi:uncharacterized HAD superfamily protein